MRDKRERVRESNVMEKQIAAMTNRSPPIENALQFPREVNETVAPRS